MKKIFILFLSVVLVKFSEAQILKKIGERAKQKVEQRADQKVDRSIDEGLDEVEGKGKAKTGGEETNNNVIQAKNTSSPQALEAYSKYDFVQGEKVVAYEDFSHVAVGDFPSRWNTNATAEVVTLNNKEGKWFKINKEGVWHPEFIDNLPENFTLEFDLGVNNGFEGNSFVMNIANLDDREKEYTDFYHYVNWRHGHALHMQFKPSNGTGSAYGKLQAATDGNYTVNNDVEFGNWNNAANNFAHISLWRQNQRLRIYVNGQKVFDVPRAFQAGGKYNTITYAMQGNYKPDDYYLINNIRLAVGAPDTRNKLITEGRFVTTGINFDVASDKLKPTSYGVLKEIAGALTENPDVKIKILGHTDSDGDDAKNLELSKRRAASVKAALASEFKIDASRIETDGLGETKPVADNKTQEAKAQNRRVEFIKM